MQHRMPIPEPILKALVALAWLSGFFSFAAVTLLSFYGLGRIGEVLPVLRSDLFLPSDDWWNQSQAAFLTLRSSKTMHRRRGRIQHMKITDARAVSLLEKLYGQRPGGYRLFPQTPSAYRYRWNKLLETLSVPPEARLTPGGLRGGGAVQSYRSGVAITEIQWRMRLRHLLWSFTCRRLVLPRLSLRSVKLAPPRCAPRVPSTSSCDLFFSAALASDAATRCTSASPRSPSASAGP